MIPCRPATLASLLSLGALLVLPGCTTWRVQPVPAAQLIAERLPSQVRLDRGAGSRLVLTWPRVVGDSIRGRQGAIAIVDVTGVAIRRFDPLKSLALVSTPVVALGIICAATDCLNFSMNFGGFSRMAPEP